MAHEAQQGRSKYCTPREPRAAERFAGAVEQMAAELAEGDPGAESLRQAVTRAVGPLTSAHQLAALNRAWPPDGPGQREWPRTAKALSGHPTRIGPNLERLGWTVVEPQRGGKAVRSGGPSRRRP